MAQHPSSGPSPKASPLVSGHPNHLYMDWDRSSVKGGYFFCRCRKQLKCCTNYIFVL